MSFDRRQMLGAGFTSVMGLGAMAAVTDVAAAGRRSRQGPPVEHLGGGIAASALGLYPDTGKIVSDKMQQAIDIASAARQPLILPPGRYLISDISLRDNSSIVGVAGATVLQFSGGGSFLLAVKASHVQLAGLVIDGALKPMNTNQADGLLMAYNCRQLRLRDLTITRSLLNGVSLRKTSASVKDCAISQARQCGLFSLDAEGLEVAHNSISDCGNNGIQIWRKQPGEDGSMIFGNRIARIAANAGGSGQNGNGINVYRAGSVQISGNRITDCAYSAVRGNGASNIQMLSNSCERLGEMALYAEFGFEGAMIANNLVDGAASGIAATNFNEGGRLALIQGNIIRNLKRREFEPHDKRGNGISVEADALVTGNIIETAATSGIMVGWGKYLRDVTVTSNLIRGARLGIGISSNAAAGTCVVAHNMISGSRIGAIRAMDHARPVGPDLAPVGDTNNPTKSEYLRLGDGTIQLSGNIAV